MQFVDPLLAATYPAEQLVHVEYPLDEYVPAEQTVELAIQEVEPALEEVLVPQPIQVDDDADEE